MEVSRRDLLKKSLLALMLALPLWAGAQMTQPESDPLPYPCVPEPKVRTIEECYPGRRSGERRPGDIYGIDVSHYQGQIDWDEVARDSRVRFVYLKCTEGGKLQDNTYRRNLQECRRLGLPVGVYHFFSPTVSAQEQLANFRNTSDPRVQSLLPIVDIESVPQIRRGRRRWETGNIREWQNRLKTFVKGVEEIYGVKPMLYTYTNFYHKYLMGIFPDYKYIIACYQNEMPKMNDELGFIMWQFTSSGSIRGIKGRVDRSRLIDPNDLRDIEYRR